MAFSLYTFTLPSPPLSPLPPLYLIHHVLPNILKHVILGGFLVKQPREFELEQLSVGREETKEEERIKEKKKGGFRGFRGEGSRICCTTFPPLHSSNYFAFGL